VSEIVMCNKRQTANQNYAALLIMTT